MKYFLTLVIFLALSPCGKAQNWMIYPGASEALSLGPNIYISPGEYAYGGMFTDGVGVQCGIVIRVSGSNIVWSHKFEMGTRIDAMMLAANGDIVAAGGKFSDAFIARLSPLGNTVWANSLATGVFESFRGVAEWNGSIYAVGIRGSTRQQIVVKFTASGTQTWARQQNATPISEFADRVVVRNDSVFVFGTESAVGARDVSIRILNASSCNEIMHRTYGDLFGGDWTFDAISLIGGDYFVSITKLAGASSSTGILRINSAFNLIAGSSALYSMPGYNLSGAHLASNGSELFASFQISSAAEYHSYMMKLDASLNPLWHHALVANASATRPILEGSQVSVLSMKNTAPLNPLLPSVYPVISGMLQSNGAFLGTPCEVGPVKTLSASAYPNLGQTTHATMAWFDPGFTLTPSSPVVPHTFAITNCDVMLPVELTSFTAQVFGSEVVLEWLTASEHDNDYFTVERSRDQEVWHKLIEVDGAGNSQVATEYRETDPHPHVGTSYYRLRQTDFDGTTTVSGVEVVEMDAPDELHLWPNPLASGQVLHGFGEEDFQIFDLSGRLVLKGYGEGILDLPSGTYVFRLKREPERMAKIQVTN